jgi:hypothetical protein
MADNQTDWRFDGLKRDIDWRFDSLNRYVDQRFDRIEAELRRAKTPPPVRTDIGLSWIYSIFNLMVGASIGLSILVIFNHLAGAR